MFRYCVIIFMSDLISNYFELDFNEIFINILNCYRQLIMVFSILTSRILIINKPELTS